MTPLKNTPLAERPRERLVNSGNVSLSLEDLVAILVRTGSKDQDIFEVSRRISDYLLTGKLSVQELSTIPGVGMAKAAVVAAALQLPAVLQQRSGRFILSDPEKIYAACHDLLTEPQEHLVVFYLTVRNQQIARHLVSIGTATASLVHSREVFRPAILHNASHIVLAHNHPSGDPSPSQADKEVTLRMARAGKELGIEVVDHVICGRDRFTSLKSVFPELFF